jgi:hypothetical protein
MVLVMSQRDPHPLEKTLATVQRDCANAVNDAQNSEIVSRFHSWVSATHERCEREIELLKVRRCHLHYAMMCAPDAETLEEWFGVCSALGHAEENFLLLNDYVLEITSNTSGQLDSTHPSGLALWLQYRTMLQGAKTPTEKPSDSPPPE